MRILSAAFYQRPTLTVARDLLGKVFVRRLGEDALRGRIVEVEAYHQQGDEAAHTFRGRTARNEVMFHAGGFLYVYFTYGMHHCMNVVTEGEGVGAAVLIRALEPLDGLAVMRRNRVRPCRDVDLANGPAKLCQAFALTRVHNGLPLDGRVVGIADAPAVPESAVMTTTRIGISRGRDLPWRFCLAGSPWCSPGRPSLPNP